MGDASDHGRPVNDPSAAPGDDPTLAMLVPQPSTGRNVLLGLLGLAALAAAWVSPPMLRPSANAEGSTFGSWSPLGAHHQVLVYVDVRPEAWPYATLTGVDDVAGARVAGAWLLPGAVMPEVHNLAPAEFASGVAYLAAGLPADDLTAAELPQRIHDDTATLIILWDIVDCARLRADQRIQVKVRSAIGSTHRESLGEIASPGFDLTTLSGSGTCPQ